MPPERFAPDDPREWLRQARVDLRVARLAPDDLEREPFAFHAQQAAEKALKAVLLTRGIGGMRLSREWSEAIEQGRLLVLSPFADRHRRAC